MMKAALTSNPELVGHSSRQNRLRMSVGRGLRASGVFDFRGEIVRHYTKGPRLLVHPQSCGGESILRASIFTGFPCFHCHTADLGQILPPVSCDSLCASSGVIAPEQNLPVQPILYVVFVKGIVLPLVRFRAKDSWDLCHLPRSLARRDGLPRSGSDPCRHSRKQLVADA